MGALSTFFGKERIEEMRKEIIEDEIFKEYTDTQGRVKIRNFGTKEKDKNTQLSFGSYGREGIQYSIIWS